MEAPINVKLQSPTVAIPDWSRQANDWRKLNAEAHGNPEFHPLTIKFAYLIGVIHDICESIARLLGDQDFAKHTSYVPAYALFASSVEILGRCVKGEDQYHKSTLKAGFQWLADPRFPEYQTVGKNAVLIHTRQRGYTIEQLDQLRNFAAHGQATSAFYTIDYEILSELRPLLRDGLEHYWARLQESEDLCNKLALANIVPLRGWPVLKTWLLLEGTPHDGFPSLTDLFDKFDTAFRL